ncbi:MAG: glycosyltransferase family 1 protein [Magnetococcales bacterium]|nr:glycosyltransferase family 1 protein [Magnetococcales bacterium]
MILMGFRRPFVPLEESLIAQGERLIPWIPGTKLPEEARRADAAVLDFTEAARHLVSVFRLTRQLHQRGKPVATLNRDAPWNKGVRARRIWALRQLRIADIHLTHALQGQTVAPRTHYFPNAADLARYHLHGASLDQLRDPDRYRYAVSFIGNIDDARYPEHRPRMALLRPLQSRLASLGIALELFHSEGMSLPQQVEVIQRSRINLNLGAACDHGGERSWGLPERCYGVPACGGFLLSDARHHATEDFTPDEEWIDFTTLDSCVSRIQALLGDFPRTRRIAEAAHRRVLADHTYACRARTLRALLQPTERRNPKGIALGSHQGPMAPGPHPV